MTMKWRKGIGEVKRRGIFQRDNYICVYCGADGDSIDHVMPVSRGGTDDRSNLVVSCWRCNRLAFDIVFDNIKDKRLYLLRKRREMDNYQMPDYFEYRQPWHSNVYGCPRRTPVKFSRKPRPYP